MIKFIKTNLNDMDKFKRAIQDQIIEMASRVISPLWDDWEYYEREYGEEYDIKDFAEDFYEYDLYSMKIVGNTVIFNDHLNVEGACSENFYDLEKMARGLQKLYPDLRVYGYGDIDYHIENEKYVLLCEGENIAFLTYNKYDWISWLYWLYSGYTVEELVNEYDDFSVEKLKKDITAFLSSHSFQVSVEELLDILELSMLKEL